MAERPDDPSSEARELAGQLGELDAFAHLDSLQLLEIASRFSIFALQQGETLVEQGEKGDSMFVLLEGRLSVTIGENGSAGQALAELEPGSIIGEVAMVAGGRRSATVRAETPSRVAALGAKGFNLLLENHPGAAASFARLASRRSMVSSALRTPRCVRTNGIRGTTGGSSSRSR